MTDDQDVSLARLDERVKAVDTRMETHESRTRTLENRQWWFVGAIIALLVEMVVGLSNIGTPL